MLEHFRAEPPLALKAINRVSFIELLLVGSAASLLEGDRLMMDCVIRGPVPVVIRSLAAQVAHPCLSGGSTFQSISITARDSATVYWAVEPLIVAGQARHEGVVNVDVDGSSRVLIRDIAILGRSGEDVRTAALATRTEARVDGRLVFEDGLDTMDGGAHGPAGLAGHRVIGTVASIGERRVIEPTPPIDPLQSARGSAASSGLRWSVSPLAAEGMIIRSMSSDLSSAQPIFELSDAWWQSMKGSSS